MRTCRSCIYRQFANEGLNRFEFCANKKITTGKPKNRIKFGPTKCIEFERKREYKEKRDL